MRHLARSFVASLVIAALPTPASHAQAFPESERQKAAEARKKAEEKTTDDALFPHDATTLLVNSRKVPWTQSGFRASVFRMIRDLEQLGVVEDGLTIHGLRHTCATRLREMGYDLRTIADMLGQETEGMAGHYAKEADLKGKLDGVIDRLDNELG
jgi:integrase